MRTEADIVRVAAALASPCRASIMLALLDGESLSAGALARLTGQSTSQTSSHLDRLEDLGLIASERTGRNRYLRLRSHEVATAIDALTRISPQPERIGQTRAPTSLSAARTCYDHLAGKLGVAIADALLDRKMLTADGAHMRFTHDGEDWFARIGVDVSALKARRRVLARSCLDWTLRRSHLAGAVGAELAAFLFAHDLIRPRPGSRAIIVTAAGASWLDRELGIASELLPSLARPAR